MSHEGDGMKLRDLARGSSSPTSFMPALYIFRSRLRNGGTSRRSRKSYESVLDRLLFRAFSRCCSKRPWSLFLAFFVILAILAPLLPFLFGRIMRIETFVSVRTADCFVGFPNLLTEPRQGIPRGFGRRRLIQG